MLLVIQYSSIGLFLTSIRVRHVHILQFLVIIKTTKHSFCKLYVNMYANVLFFKVCLYTRYLYYVRNCFVITCPLLASFWLVLPRHRVIQMGMRRLNLAISLNFICKTNYNIVNTTNTNLGWIQYQSVCEFVTIIRVLVGVRQPSVQLRLI